MIVIGITSITHFNSFESFVCENMQRIWICCMVKDKIGENALWSSKTMRPLKSKR